MIDDLADFMKLLEAVGPWRTWTKQNKGGKVGVIECPKCKGKMHLSQSPSNGHVHGACETKDCLRFME